MNPPKGGADMTAGSIAASGFRKDTELQRSEAQVLAQERRIRAQAAGADVRTSEHTTVGSDGKRYVTSISITVTGPEDVVDRIGGGSKGVSVDTALQPGETTSGKDGGPKRASDASSTAKDPTYSAKIRQSVEKLKAIERDVIAHEAAHKAVGGQYAGAVSYSYTTGPDGKRYITGGEVPISAPAGRTPEETIRIMERVQRAALAAGSPSPQDISVASSAAALQAAARQELSQGQAEKAYGQWTLTQDAPSRKSEDAWRTPWSIVA